MFKKIDTGILFMLLGALISAISGALTKILAADMSALEIVFLRNVVGVLLILVALKHTLPTLSGGKIHLLFVRGLFGFLAMILFFYTITVIPLAEAITLNKTSPLFVSILAYYLLHERLSKTTLVALLIGFLGVVLVVKPFEMSLSYAHFLAILGGFFAAAAYTTIKKIKDIYDSRIIVLSFVSVGTVVPAVLFLIAPIITPHPSVAFLFPEFIIPSSIKTWLLITFMAIMATFSQWLLTKAYSSSNLSIVGVISYMNIPFAIGFGWLLGDGFADTLTYMGIGLIIFGGFLVGMQNKR